MDDILYDRSRTVTDWRCSRARYWGYEHDGKGLTKSTSLALHTGIIVHDCLAAIATQHPDVDIDTIAMTASMAMKKALLEASDGEVGADEFANEQASLTEGMIRGFYQHAWPLLLSQYPIIKHIEKEVTYKHDGLVFMSKPDLILENLEGDWIYIEYKTTSSKKAEWITSWETAVQLHSACKAVEQTLGVLPSAVQIVGLYKGYRSYNRQNSPFCYAYMKKGNPPFTEDVIQYEWKAGLKKYAVWELEGGVKAWVEEMPSSVLTGLFPMTPPIFINNDLVDAFFRQRAIREHEIATYEPENKLFTLDKVFPQKFDACQPGWGQGCEFRKLCFGRCDDPLKEGFTYRTPHHDLELEEQSGE